MPNTEHFYVYKIIIIFLGYMYSLNMNHSHATKNLLLILNHLFCWIQNIFGKLFVRIKKVVPFPAPVNLGGTFVVINVYEILSQYFDSVFTVFSLNPDSNRIEESPFLFTFFLQNLYIYMILSWVYGSWVTLNQLALVNSLDFSS